MIHPVHTLSYAGYLTWEVVVGALVVARDAFTPGRGTTPMIVELPLACDTDLEITLMASSITITPGTLTLGIAPAGDDQPATLYVHSMYTAERADTIASLRDMERRLLRVTRGREGPP